VSKVFDGEASTLVKRLVESKDLGDDELKAIRTILNRRIGS
jgi:predicted transcriptional regulator